MPLTSINKPGLCVKPYRFSVEEFNKLPEVGIFDEDDRVELLDGEIIVMSPIGSQHAGTVMRINAILHGRVGSDVIFGLQTPTVVEEFSEPLPDVMLLKPRKDFYTSRHPVPKDILLLIEVSDTTLRYDRGRKLRKYAETRVSEVWIVNLENMTIEQYREPSGDSFASKRIFQRGEQITIAAFPDNAFPVEELIG